jgi:hypothetical protein
MAEMNSALVVLVISNDVSINDLFCKIARSFWVEK